MFGTKLNVITFEILCYMRDCTAIVHIRSSTSLSL